MITTVNDDVVFPMRKPDKRPQYANPWAEILQYFHK